LFLLAGLTARSQQSQAVVDYINTYSQLAITEMLRTGVPASITLAQGIHESEAGQSELVLRSNNHFGIKCKTGWTGEKVYHDDDDEGECFRGYPSANESYADHSDFLKLSARYAFLFKLDPLDYKGWAYGLKDAGYATNIRYSQLLIKLVEDYNLQQYSLFALSKTDPSSLPKQVLSTTVLVKTAPDELQFSSFKRKRFRASDFPVGVFRINRLKVVFTEEGTSILKLSRKYKLPVRRLMQYNGWDKKMEFLSESQLVFLQAPKKKGPRPYHKVEDGETLATIADLEGMKLESLLNFNLLSSEMQPLPGQNLYLQKQAPKRPQLLTLARKTPSRALPPQVIPSDTLPVKIESVTTATAPIVHVVKPKETLFGISRLYNITVEKLVEWNKLADKALKIGQELIIYK
jgi:LysM repeat protein